MVPKRYQIKSVDQETSDTMTFQLSPMEGNLPSFLPGQFNMLYLLGFGEVPISISSAPSQKDAFSHTIRAVGPLTEAMCRLKKGDELGVRGPFGSSWPLSGKVENILIISGGLGLAPLRPVLLHLSASRSQFKDVTLLYGARTPDDLLYKSALLKWNEQGIEVKTSVDRADTNWRGNVGVITALINKHLSQPQNTRIFICGPEIMMKYALNEIMRFNVPENEIFLSMERNMKCAVGFCGHCQYGPYFLCKDGPIFSFQQLKPYLPIKEL